MENKLESITFTNYGYLDFTLNLLNSIEKNNVDLELSIYCTDIKSFNELENKGYKAINIISELESSNNKLEWEAGNEDFGLIMIKKFEAIYNSLKENKLVLYIDGDVVIKKDITDYLCNEIGDNDFLFQLDYNPKKTEQNDLCAGFMMIKSQEETLNLFNPNNLDIEKIIKLPSHDQTYLNQNKESFKYNFLPIQEFPNGAFFMNFETNPKIIHFNYLIGKNKKKTMQKCGEWYL
tara:strand:- start:8074 stop:8778 length:705 start_codon:yes stop_codon:yes gene_type:complete